MKPLKAHNYEEARVVYPCWVQPKLDGIRAMFHHRRFHSGDEKTWNDNVVAHLRDKILKAFPSGARLDGEFYKHGWKTQQINGAIAVKRVAPVANTKLIEFHVFDAIRDNICFADRTREVLQIVRRIECPQIKMVVPQLVRNKKEADAYYAKCVLAGFEGIMYRMSVTKNGKHEDTGYVSGRSWLLLKRKEMFDDEFRVVDITEGKMTDKGGKHVGRTGALVCQTKSGKIFHVGTGYSDQDRERLWKNPPIGKKLTVFYRVLSADGIPIEPRAKGIREEGM